MRRASLNSMFCWRMTKENASPPVEHAPKQCQLWRSGLTMNEGVRSVWKGQGALKLRPAFWSAM